MYKLLFVFAVFTVIFINYCESKPERSVVVFEPAIKDEIRNAMKECSKKETDFPELSQFMKDGSIKDDKEFKEYIFCLSKRTGYADEATGRVKIDKASASFPDPELMKKIMTDCDKEATLKPVDPVETTFLHFKCYQSKTPYSVNID